MKKDSFKAFKERWKNSSLPYKAATIVSILTSLSVVVLAALQIFDVWDKAVNLCLPIMAVNMLSLARIEWKTCRKAAYFSIGVAVFVLACAVAVFFPK